MQQTILITGGAGYIGSHAVYAFLNSGWQPVVIDNLSTGSRRFLPDSVPFYHMDLEETDNVRAVIIQHACTSIAHFAGSIVVPESIANPLLYYRNNTAVSRGLLEIAVACGVEAFLFSSTAAVYGQPDQVPITEDTPTMPINPYGASKLMTESMLKDVAAAYPMHYGILRYFNVAGADPLGRTGQSTPLATHLIKVAAEVACGKRKSMALYGTDYPTIDGTCVRDYIHVMDLAEAHVLTLEHMLKQRTSVLMNCGYGQGYSVKQVLDAVRMVAGVPLPVETAPRRAGDPAALVADNQRILKTLDWQPKYNDLQYIVKTALDWERKIA